MMLWVCVPNIPSTDPRNILIEKAHVHAFGQVAPAAAGIIHWGVTSCYCTVSLEIEG